MSNHQLRTVLRWIHLIGGLSFGVFVYSPLRTNEAFTLLLQVVIIPVVLLSGLWMWQQARVSRWLRGQTKRNS
jgi:hypothetical protein